MNRKTLSLLAVLLLPAAPASQGVNPSDLLPVDEAFAISARVLDDQRIAVRWDIAEGYYMYRGRISFASDTAGVTLGDPELPPGEHKVDEFFGEVQTYREGVDVFIPFGLSSGTPDSLVIEARSQGCADLGVCYPPHTQTLNLAIPSASSGLQPASAESGANPLAALGASPGSGSGLTGAAPAQSIMGQQEALPEDVAFVYEAAAVAVDEILVRFTIAPGYYMYQDKFSFNLDDPSAATLGQADFPPAVAHKDEHFGDVNVYYDQVEIGLPLQRHAAGAPTVTLDADFMGCKEAGICYPPMNRSVAVELPAAGADDLTPRSTPRSSTDAVDGPEAVDTRIGQTDESGAGPRSESDRLAAALADDDLWLTLLLFVGLGLALAFTPCVFPMIPILSGIIAGQGDSITTRRAFVLSLVYVLAMALVYTAIGVIAGLSGYNLQAAFQNQWVLLTFAGVMVALALAMFGFYELQLPSRWQSRLTEMSNSQSGGTLVGAAIMGMLSALIVGPCVAPPLMGALIYISQTGDGVLGGLALFSLALGMGLPLLLIGTSAGRLLPRAGGWMNAVKAVFGVGLLALAIWLLERILPPTAIMLLWAALAIACAVYLGALERIPEGASGWRRLWKSLGVLLLLLGAIQLIGALSGGRDWMNPLSRIQGGGTEAVSQQAQREFEVIKTGADLDRRLARAAARDQTVMLDFYADWCVDCKRMERYTFPAAEVQTALADSLLLKADVTANDAADQSLLQRFGLIGPPAILFFDGNGQERRAWRVIGYMRAPEFAAHAGGALGANDPSG